MELPKVYANPDGFLVSVNQSSSDCREEEALTLEEVFDTSSKYMFHHNYQILLKDGTVYLGKLVSRYDTYILTMEGTRILVDDILRIDEIKK